MAEGDKDSEKILNFARYLREKKCDIDKEFTVELNPLLSEMRFKKQSNYEVDECIEAMEDVLKSLNAISSTVATLKDKFQDAKIKGLQKQLRLSQLREQSGRTSGVNGDSGCYSADSRLLSTESGLITQETGNDVLAREDDVTSTSRIVTSIHTEPTQHEDTSNFDKMGDDSAC